MRVDPTTSPNMNGASKPARSRRLHYSDLLAAHANIRAERDWFAVGAIDGAPILVWIGPEKAHKSWVAADLVVCTVLGGTWLGAFEVEPQGDALVVDGEYGDEEYARRLARLARGRGRDPGDVFARVRHFDGRGLFLSPESELARDLLADLKADPPALIVIDPWRNFLAGDENNAGDNIDAMRVVATLRRASDAPVVIVHHLNRAGTMSGSRAIRTRADVLVDGTDDAVPTYTTIGRTYRSGDRITTPFSVEVIHENDDDDTIASTRLVARFVGERASGATAKTLSAPAKRILEHLRRCATPVTGAELGRLANVTSGQTRSKALGELHAAGHATYREGRWELSTGSFFGDLQTEKEGGQ